MPTRVGSLPAPYGSGVLIDAAYWACDIELSAGSGAPKCPAW
jgi:hypothetical protein